MNLFLIAYCIVITLIAYFSIALIIQYINRIVYFIKGTNHTIGTNGLYFKLIILSILIGIYNYILI